MFSMTPCLAPTSQAATSTAPAAPQGRIQETRAVSVSTPMVLNTPAVSPSSTPPPSPIST